jgi:hypothetical protein
MLCSGLEQRVSKELRASGPEVYTQARQSSRCYARQEAWTAEGEAVESLPVRREGGGA